MDHRLRQAGSGWTAGSYREEAAHHRSLDDWFISQHPPGTRDTVVDVGCGSGEFTALLASVVTEGRVIGVEPDHSMLDAAKHHEARNLEFRQGDLQTLDQVCGPSSADLIVSRAVFHWIQLSNYPDCYEAVRKTLRPGAWFHAESGGEGNVASLWAVLDPIAAELGLGAASLTFPSPGTALELLERVGFDIPHSGVTTVAQRRSFDWERLKGFIRTQAAMAYGVSADAALAEELVVGASRRRHELRRHDGSYDQTFVRLHVRVRRPEEHLRD